MRPGIEIKHRDSRFSTKGGKYFFLTLFFIIYIWEMNGQSGIASAHGMAGNISYTLGQTFYKQVAQGINLSEGVEQGYLIVVSLTDDVCESSPYSRFGFELGDTLETGEYHFHNYLYNSILHYDSVTQLTLTVHPIWRIEDTLLVRNGTTDPSEAGTHIDTLTSQYGCDSIVARTIYIVYCPDDYEDTATYGEDYVPLALAPPDIFPPHPLLRIMSDVPALLPVGSPHLITWQVVAGGDTLLCTQNAIVHFPPCGDDYTVVDRDSNIYHTIRVGAICWMKENLRSTLYSNGDTILDSRVYTIGADTVSDWEIYGLLYSWYSAVNIPEGADSLPATDSAGRVQGVCPTGWHIPHSDEMIQLAFENSQSLRINNEMWLGEADNLSGFSAAPAGDYDARTGYFEYLRTVAHFWTDEKQTTHYATVGTLPNMCDDFYLERFFAQNGCSVRCVKN